MCRVEHGVRRLQPAGPGIPDGNYRPEATADDDFRKRNPRFVGKAQAQNQQLVDALAPFATERNLSSSQLAEASLIKKHPHVMPIPATRRVSYLDPHPLPIAPKKFF